MAWPVKFQADDTDAGALLEVLGRKKFEALQERFGGRRLWIPKNGGEARCGACAWRDRCIRLLRQEGRPVDEIAKLMALSPKSVYRIIGGIRGKPR